MPGQRLPFWFRVTAAEVAEDDAKRSEGEAQRMETNARQVADWIINGTNFIVGRVTASAFLATNVVATGGKILAAEYTVTNDLASVTASAHYGVDSPDSATFYFGDPIIVTGATDGDVIKLILK